MVITTHPKKTQDNIGGVSDHQRKEHAIMFMMYLKEVEEELELFR